MWRKVWWTWKYIWNCEKVDRYTCDVCDNVFQVKWRLRKHADIHTRKNIKKCQYYNNSKNGCKFLHEESDMCFFGQKCGNILCPFKHNKAQRLVESEWKSCKKCSFISKRNLDLNEHVRSCHAKVSSTIKKSLKQQNSN